MEIKRFFVEACDIANGSVRIVGEEALHIINVLRYKIGFKIIVNNNLDNLDYYCNITSIDRDAVNAIVDSILPNKSVYAKRIRLFMALPKGDKADFIVQKAVELGVDQITFINTQYVNENKFNKTRMLKIAKEAAKQCGAAIYPDVMGLVTFSDMLNSYLVSGVTIMFYENEKNNYVSDVANYIINNEIINIIIGSEGGFSDSEYGAAITNGVISVSLGDRIMRCETAAVVALTLVTYIGVGMCGGCNESSSI